MAYQTRGRDPLLDSGTQAAIEKRGRELLGLGLLAVGVMTAMMIGSYSPDDPNWMVASDAPVENWLGRFGASIAHPLFMIAGRGGWMIPLVFAAWGIRMAGHWGEDRAIGRVIFAPIAVALAAIYAATIPPSADWVHSFGLGGLFGDTVLSILLTMLPLGAGFGVKLLSLAAGVASLAGLAFVTGFTMPEIRTIRRFLLVGLVMAYAVVLQVAARLGAVSLGVAQTVQDRVAAEVAQRREQARIDRAFAAAEEAATRAVPAPNEAARVAAVVRANPNRPVDHRTDRRPAPAAQAMPGTVARARAETRAEPRTEPRAEPPVDGGVPRMPPAMSGRTAPPPPGAAAQPRPIQGEARPLAAPRREQPAPQPAAGGFLSSFLKRSEPRETMPAPELVETAAYDAEVGVPDDARIRSRIADAIRARTRNAEPEPAPEPLPLRARGPKPLILDLAPRAAAAVASSLRAEPRYAAEPTARTGRTEPPVTGRAEPRVTAEPAHPAAEPEAARGLPPAPHWEEQEDEDELVADEEWMTAPMKPFEAQPRMAPPPLRTPEAKKVVQHPPKKAAAPSARAQAEAQPALPLEDKYADYDYPPLNLLTDPSTIRRHHLSDEALEENARMLESVLDDYGVKGEIVSVRPGPVVTMYELEPAPGLKASRVIGLADDIARSMSALSARVSTVPGRSVIGIELPNANREKVVLREILSARDFGDGQAKLPLALGKDIGGEPIVANLAKMPHLLIAGTTGSGKSVAINTMILSLLYKLTPAECRLIMIDPKMLELSVYDGIPHLLSPVVTDPKKAVVALKWVVGEMEERYRKMSKMGVRNIDGYNGRVKEALDRGEMFSRTIQTGFDDDTGDPVFETDEFQPEHMPYIVVIVDEMADLMMVAGKEIEACIQRLAQMARASGIHLIMATQRPSVDVITGTIKANFPTRISFQVTSKIDSRTILGEQGAEQLLGMGDMLYMAGGSKITRIHGPFCSDEEVEEIVTFLKGFGPPDYMSGVVEGPDEESASDIDAVLGLGSGDDTENALYDMAVQIVAKDRKCSTSYIQRKLAIGYNKAARLVEQMEDQGIVTPANHVGKREILVPEVHH